MSRKKKKRHFTGSNAEQRLATTPDYYDLKNERDSN